MAYSGGHLEKFILAAGEKQIKSGSRDLVRRPVQESRRHTLVEPGREWLLGEVTRPSPLSKTESTGAELSGGKCGDREVRERGTEDDACSWPERLGKE